MTAILQANVDWMWRTVILPRVGDIYVFGGSLNPSAVNQGTDCSGAVSEADEGMEYGPQMNWARQFWTGTFAGVSPGQKGSFGGINLTGDWTCISSPSAAPPGAAMRVAVLQDSDPMQAHMVCEVLDNNNVTGVGGPGIYVGIESGGQFIDADGNSTLHISPEATPWTDPEFNQWFVTGPITDSAPGPPAFIPVGGVDFSGGLAGGAALAAAGYKFACRYVYNGGPSLPHKLLTLAESRDLIANSVAPVSNYESSGVDALNGFSQGVADANEANSNHIAAGGPPARPIYFSLDWDEGPTQDAAVDAYFSGIASVIGLARTGAYGGYWIIKRLLDAGLITWAWQANAWSGDPGGLAPLGPGGNYLDPRANILQLLGTVTVNGVQCDTDVAYTPDFGQWGYVPPPPGGFLVTTPGPSQSPFRAEGEGSIWSPSQLVFNDDGFLHPMYVSWAAGYGQQWAITLLETIAALKDPSRAADTALAQMILSRLTTPGPVPVPPPAPTPVVVTKSGFKASTVVKTAITVLGGTLTTATWLAHVLGGVLSPTATGAIASGILGVTAIMNFLVKEEPAIQQVFGTPEGKK